MRKRQIAALFLFVVGIGLIIFSFWPEAKKQNSFNGQISGAQVEKTSGPEATPQVKPTTAISVLAPSPLFSPTSQPITNSPAVANTPAPTPVPASQQIQVNLSINGGGSFSVNVDEGNNQCDVLTKAKEQGKISSLNMQFNNSLGSYGVYQINGIGKENYVWWVYKVNGVPPKSGCSSIKANNGDKIEWQYIGS